MYLDLFQMKKFLPIGLIPISIRGKKAITRDDKSSWPKTVYSLQNRVRLKTCIYHNSSLYISS